MYTVKGSGLTIFMENQKVIIFPFANQCNVSRLFVTKSEKENIHSCITISYKNLNRYLLPGEIIHMYEIYIQCIKLERLYTHCLL